MNAERRARVLVTGGTGMIGALLVARLLAERHHVAVLVREGSNRLRLRSIEDRLQILIGDIRDSTAVRAAVEQTSPDVVYHLASTSFNPATISTECHMQVIVMGTVNLLEALRGRPGVRIVYTGSAAEYGSGSALTEHHPLKPATILGVAKATASTLAQTYARLHQMETVVLRLFTPYGPWEHPRRLIPYTILSALNGQDIHLADGRQQRDYFYVEDLLDALLLAGMNPVLPGTTLNLCSGSGRSVQQIVETILTLMDRPTRVVLGARPTRPDEIWECCGDNTAAKSLLSWTPRTGLEEGLRKTIAWFREHRDLVSQLN